MARQFIYHMQGLSKTYPGNRKVLENINLSFYPDAKIGVLGLNGSGKSTLLRIMAGLDTEFTGEAWAAEGARVGFLPQEPQLDPDKSVRENVMDGVAPQKATHDRYFLDNVNGWILELDRGRGITYQGNYSAWLGQKQKRLEQEGREEAAHQRTLAREQEWIAASPRARQAKSKARYQRYDDLLAKAAERTIQTAQIVIPVTERLGQNVIDFEHLKKGFGDNLLIDDLTFKLPPGGIVGVIGPNGAGKTTLFRMITKQDKPDSGSIEVGESVHLGYVDQSRDSLDGKKNVWEEISGGLDQLALGKREVNSRAYCSAFNFKGADQQKKVGSLSGGERNRVHLAKMLKSGANVLLLDEPTNDLDVDTLRALEEALEDFAGCAVIISHDRWFLDRIATHMLSFEGDSHVEWFEGNFQDYEKDKMRRLGQDSVIPHRVKYKKLTR